MPHVKPSPSSRSIRSFRQAILRHYRVHGRKMPWRETADPYRILVSEIMLQQTQVSRVTGKYERFVKTFPDFKALDAASPAEVLAAWQGLGYNRRALSLKKIARAVVSRHGGKLPRSPEELAKLPGIGYATASSICAFAFDMPVVFIETNIRTVFIHFFFKKRKTVSDDELLPLVGRCLSKRNPRVWYWALMDYGAMLKKSGQRLNPRSAHYVRQERFEGSKRQVRGRILRILSGGEKIPQSKLIEKTRDSRAAAVLAELVREGFIESERGVFRLNRSPFP
jgi:A/G-specific adenine glycosylase